MLASFLVGAVVSVVFAALLQQWAKQRKIVKKVGTPLVKQQRSLPPVGGLALAIGFLAGTISWQLKGGFQWTDQFVGLVAAGAVILIVGLIDDFVKELRPWQKLLGQILAWLFLLRGGIAVQIVMLPPWANLLLSLLWTLAIINALNLLDIADGLAGGIAFIAAGTFLVICIVTEQFLLAGLLAAICGAILGVLVFNFPRATLFLGDSGSMLLGLLLAAFSLAISYAPLGREVALVTPLLVLGVLLYDLAFVTLVRIRNGRSIFGKSWDHFVFRLIHQGMSSTGAVVAILVLCLAFSLTALIVNFASNQAGVITVCGVIVVALLWAFRMARVRMDA